MIAVLSKLREVLLSNADIVSMCGHYQGQAAIFTGEEVPGDAALNWIMILPPITDIPYDTKDFTGRELVVDIWVAVRRELGGSYLDNLVELVRTTLHRIDITMTGYLFFTVLVTGIERHDPSESAIFRTVSVTINFLEVS